MGNALRDQLLKAGLANQQQAKKAEKEARKKRKQNKGKKGVPAQPTALQEDIAARQKAEQERSRALNAERQQAEEAKSLKMQVRQIIAQKHEKVGEGELTYRFSTASKVVEILVNDLQKRLLEKGRLAVASLDDKWVLIPAAAAEKVQERDAAMLGCWHQDQAVEHEDDEEDPYAQYVVPDDLMW